MKKKLNKFIEFIKEREDIKGCLFISLGKPSVKAQVKIIKQTNNLESKIEKMCHNYKKKSGEYPTWVKLDIVTNYESILFEDLKNEMLNFRRNYIDFGFTLDQNWNIAFLPEEINANAFVRPKKGTNDLYLSEDNVNNYMRKYTNYKRLFLQEYYKSKFVFKFYTKSYFLDEEDIYELESEGHKKGLRKIQKLDDEINYIIQSSSHFLKNMLREDGKFIYGYFPHFDKNIGFYNILRHSSSTYALIEGLNYLNESLIPIEKAIEYVINNYIMECDGKAFVYDNTKGLNEIKLGQNATFIFAVCEYLKVHKNEYYLQVAQNVANGILDMIEKRTGDTIHVLNYPDLSVKEKFRVIYYDGEAALALMRLYQQDYDEKWLIAVKKLMDQFIAKEYFKYHHHWLGYCTNELVQFYPEPKYFEFGIKNVNSYLNFIKNRETTFPTFLEMLMATYKLIQKAKDEGYGDLVISLIDEQKLIDITHIRANYQRLGFFYPEIAMYFKNPAKILGSFFIKHHGYRVRIDDIEHYISGYIQYLKFLNVGNNRNI